MKEVTRFTDGDHEVMLEQHDPGLFRVTYGLQVRDDLGYTDAAHEFGTCVFHSLACAGKLDNTGD